MPKYKNSILLTLSLLIGLSLMEVVLQTFASNLSLDRFNLLSKRYAKLNYFKSLEAPPNRQPPLQFDAELGWRNHEKKENTNVILNSENWRSPFEFSSNKSKPRIAFVGDSFVYGFGLKDSETLPVILQEVLGNKYEILNFGVHGFGVDQMALVANRIAPKYYPDIILMGFIAADLDRSCSAFEFNASKPRFEVVKGQLKTPDTSIPTPYQNYQDYLDSSFVSRTFAKLSALKVSSLLAQPFLYPGYRDCLETLNPKIFEWVKTQSDTPVFFTHLDGELPEAFKVSMKNLGLYYESLPAKIPSLSKAFGINADRLPDGHPSGNLNRLYAVALSAFLSPKLEWIQSQGKKS